MVMSQYVNDPRRVFVVSGFPRSGTSLLGQMLSSAGVSFGLERDLMPEDWRNPRGYFEHKNILKLSRKYLKEAGIKDDLLVSTSLRSKGLGRMTRLFTRRAMMRALQNLNLSSCGHVGLKLFPLFLHAWLPYLPKSAMLIAVYRHPSAVTASFFSAWPGGFYTGSQIMGLWTEHNRNLLALLPRFKEYVLIRYEDLLDPSSQSEVCALLEKRTGLQFDVSIFEKNLNHSGVELETQFLPVETEQILATMDTIRLTAVRNS